MACRTRPGQGLTGAFQAGHGGKQMTEAVQEHHAYWRAGCAVQQAGIGPLGKAIATQQNDYWRPPPPSPSAPPLPSQWQGALEAVAVPSPLAPQWQGALEATAVSPLVPPWQGALEAVRVAASQAFSAGGLADRHQPSPVNINVQLMYVNDLHVHVHAGPTESDRPVALDAVLPTAAPPPPSELLLHFHPNDPVFIPCCYSPQGLDFGLKVVSRAYKAKKYEDSQYNMVVYYQCSGAAESLSHTLTLHLSHKRTKHAIFLFDCSVAADELASSWSPFIHLSDIKSMIQELGPKYEYHRNKVKNERFSLYFYIIKRIGAQFSQRSQQIWSNLFRWAHAHQVSSDKSTAIAGSNVPQVISQVAGIGLGIIGAIA